MKSKIVKLGFIVVVVGGLLFGGFKFKQHLDFNANETEIRRLLTRAESRGFVTVGDKFVVKRPDEQNAWIEIGQILQKRNPSKKNQPIFDNKYAGTLLNRAYPSDIALIDAAVALNKGDRERIIEVLKKKGHLQIPFNFNEGYMMQYEPMTPLRTLVNDICLCALSHGFKRDSAAAIANLEAAYLIGSELMVQRDSLPRLAGTVIYKTISKTEMRIIEFDPSMTHVLKQLDEKWNPLYDVDPFDDYKWTFLEHLASCRNFDSPEMDHPVPLFFLDKVIKGPSEVDAQKDYSVRPGDYMPMSFRMRKYMLTTLQQWMPIMDIVSDPKSKRDIATDKSIYKQINWETDCPPLLKKSFSSLFSDQEYGVGGLFTRTQLDLNREMFRQLEYKEAYGTFASKLLTTIRSFNPSDKFSISPRGKGIQIGAGAVDAEGLHSLRACFPYSEGLPAEANSKVMSQLRDGSLKVNAPSNPPPMMSP